MSQVESALQDARIEYVEETTEGTTPDNPSWSTLTDFLDELSVDPGGSNNGINVAGTGDIQQHFRGPEEPNVEVSYYKQQAFVDTNGDDVYPAATPLTYNYNTEYPSYSLEYRRDVAGGGNFNAGFREYVVVQGAKPVEVETPGDPSEGQPVIESLTWEPEKARAYVIHQPGSSTTLDITNNGSNSVDVTVESSDASTTETVTVSGGATVTTTSRLSDVDVIHAEGEHDGDITVTDGAGTNVLDSELAGSSTTNVESERGVPPLGMGSHGSAIGTDPSKYLFGGFEPADYQGTQLADRIHALDLTVSVDVSREARAGTRRQSVDVGPRTVEVDADVAGPFESAKQNYDFYVGLEGDLVYNFPDSASVTLRNAQLTDTDEVSFAAGDGNIVYGVTFEPSGVPALTFTAASP